jgi:hypothetical protein
MYFGLSSEEKYREDAGNSFFQNTDTHIPSGVLVNI